MEYDTNERVRHKDLPRWRLKDVRWRQVFSRLDYANLLLSACIVIAVILVTALAKPHTTPYLVWDARISYPINSEMDTIPAWVAVFTPLVMFALTVILGEFITSRRQHVSVTDAVSSAIYFFFDGIQAFIMSLMLTQTFKYVVGRLRPNFLARCVPDVPTDAAFPSAASGNVTGFIANAFANQWPCKDPNGEADEGRLAFPSGHTSLCFVLAVYASGYLIWVWNWRHPLPSRRLTFWQEFRCDLVNVLAKTWMLGMLCFAWGVGVSRIVDYQHDPSDVVGAAFMGTMIALVYLLRAIPRWRRVLTVGGIDTGSEAASRHTSAFNGGAGAGGNGSRGDLSSGDVEAPVLPAAAGSAKLQQRNTSGGSGEVEL